MESIPRFSSVGLVWSNNPENYAGSSVATGRATHARQVKGDDPDKKWYPSPLGCGLGVGLTIPPHKNMFCWEASYKKESKAYQGL